MSEYIKKHIKQKTTVEEIGPKGYPAYCDHDNPCRHCGCPELERFHGAGLTEIHCCRCERITAGG